MVYGVNPADTIDLIKERARRIRQGAYPRTDARIALIVEGDNARVILRGPDGIGRSWSAGTFDEV